MAGLEKKIYIGGLHEEITEDTLYSVFLTFGNAYKIFFYQLSQFNSFNRRDKISRDPKRERDKSS